MRLVKRVACLAVALVACAHAPAGPPSEGRAPPAADAPASSSRASTAVASAPAAGASPAEDAGPADGAASAVAEPVPTLATSSSPAVVVVDAHSVFLDGVRVPGNSDPGRPDPLVAALQARRSSSDLTFDAKPGAKTSAALSALGAAALAGYTNVRFADSDVVATQAADFVPLHRALLLAIDRLGARLSWASDAPCDQSPPGGRVAGAGVAAALARACGEAPCIDEVTVLADDAVPFSRVVSAIGAAAKQGTGDFRFLVGGRGTPTTTYLCGDPVVVNIPSRPFQDVFRVEEAPMGRCFERALKRDPAAEGTVNLHLVVSPDGRVKDAAAGADSTLLDASARSCIVACARKLVFPEKAFGTRAAAVVYPLRFYNQSSTDWFLREREVLRQIQ